MKVAVVTDDSSTISTHFGMARGYLVYEIQEGVILNRELREKALHGRGETHHNGSETSLHNNMLSNVSDCEAIISRGMGRGMYSSITGLGIKPYVTNIALAEDAIQKYIEGTLDNHIERLH